MGIGKAAAVPVLLAALGAARGADISGVDGPEIDFFGGQRDPLEFCSPGEVPPPPPPPPPTDAAELARQVEEQVALGNLAEAERLVDRLLDVLRVQGMEDLEAEARAHDLRVRARGRKRAEVDPVEEFSGLDLRLSGVAWNESKPVALVNDELCVPGDVVEGATIDAILPGEVVFEFRGVRIRKSLLRPSVERVEGASPAGEPGERE
jgi:hypothetical protein